MSSVNSQRDFDYWDYVHCAVCYMPFINESNPANGQSTSPFWLTECGHTVCNNHLKPDQSCAACGSVAIQLIPLQKDLPQPMFEWFRSLPHALDGLASAAKFQQEAMANLVRFYRRKCSQFRVAAKKVEEVEVMNKRLRTKIEQLEHENDQLRNATRSSKRPYNERSSYGHGQEGFESAEVPNVNGKRPATSRRNQQGHRSSSPRSIITPPPPSRLTLPPNNQQPTFTTEGDPHVQEPSRGNSRPGTGRFEQYAFQSSSTPMRPIPIRHQQQTHVRRLEERVPNAQRRYEPAPRPAAQRPDSRMPPPPLPVPPSVQQTPRESRRVVALPGQSQPVKVIPQNENRLPPPLPSSSSVAISSSAPYSIAQSRQFNFSVQQTPSNRFFPRVQPGERDGNRARQAPPVTSSGNTRAPFFSDV